MFRLKWGKIAKSFSSFTFFICVKDFFLFRVLHLFESRLSVWQQHRVQLDWCNKSDIFSLSIKTRLFVQKICLSLSSHSKFISCVSANHAWNWTATLIHLIESYHYWACGSSLFQVRLQPLRKYTQTVGIQTECEPIGIKNIAYREMLLGFVVLIEVDAGSAVLLHGITGQQLSDGHNTQGYASGNLNKV